MELDGAMNESAVSEELIQPLTSSALSHENNPKFSHKESYQELKNHLQEYIVNELSAIGMKNPEPIVEHIVDHLEIIITASGGLFLAGGAGVLANEEKIKEWMGFQKHKGKSK